MPHRVVSSSERLLTPASIAGLAVSALLLLLIATGSVLVSLRTQHATEASQVLQHDRAAATDALLSIERAETGQRGYLLTGRDLYMAAYQRAADAAPARLAALAASQDMTESVVRLRALADTKLAELARTVALARAGHHDEALALVQTDLGQDTMRDYRALSAQVIAREDAALGTLVARIGDDTSLLVWLDVLAVVAVLAVAGQIAIGVRRAVTLLRAARRDLAIANDELSQANEGLELAVRRRTAELVHANDEIQRFAYIVSHDLRSPLVNVMGFTSELEAVQATLRTHLAQTGTSEADLPGPVRLAVFEDMPEAIRFIRSSTSKMDRLIGAILRLSREGRRDLVAEALDMAALLRNAADATAHAAQAAGATIEVADSDSAGMPDIVADRLAMEQVFANLIENALKYAQPGRPVRVVLAGTRAGPRVRFTVTDNGRGIAGRDLERIFDLFRRAGDQNVPGEGIGLAHVRALVRRLGGMITCTSVLGEGTVFTVELPAEAAQRTDLAA